MPAIVLTNGTLTTAGQIFLEKLMLGTQVVPDSYNLMAYGEGFAPDRSTTFATFNTNVVDFGGYATVAITFSGPVIGVDGQARLIGNNAIFTTDDGDPADTVAGLMLFATVDGTPDVSTAIMFWNLADPILIDTPGQGFGAKPIVLLNADGSELLLES